MVKLIMLKATFNNISVISWQPVLLVEVTGVPEENHRPVVSHWLAHGRWFSPGTPASSTTKTGRHDIAESGVKTPKINQSIFSWP
jgi:hypothetical protein